MPTPDFSKVWASNSPLPAYTFTDADYLTGWDFVGSAPPTKNEFDAWFSLVDTKLNWLYSQLQDTASKLYPVGSVYISFNSADPSTLFGGTWTRLKDRMLMASGDTYTPDTTGGSATKTIGVTNLPAHNHTVNSAGSHNHTASTGAGGIHNHTASTGGAGSHTHTASSNTTGNHTHTRGTMTITGWFDVADAWGSGGAFTNESYKSDHNQLYEGGEYNTKVNFDAGRNNGAYWTGATSSAGNHSHTITVNSVSNHTHTVSVANSTSHTHTVTINNNGSHTHTTNNTGGGTPLNILPPYMTVYMWRRTA